MALHERFTTALTNVYVLNWVVKTMQAKTSLQYTIDPCVDSRGVRLCVINLSIRTKSTLNCCRASWVASRHSP